MKRKKVIWLATANPNKAKEFKEILSDFDVRTLADLKKPLDIEETGKTFEENAMIKAKALAEAVNAPAIGDDSGLEIEKMKGWPGIYSKRWALPEKDPAKINQMLLKKMEQKGLVSEKDRAADFITVVAYYDPIKKEEKYFKGEVWGQIADQPRGKEAFGYDPIFQPHNNKKTFAEMTAEEKNKISHRNAAIRKFKDFYNNKFPGKNGLLSWIRLTFLSGED